MARLANQLAVTNTPAPAKRTARLPMPPPSVVVDMFELESWAADPTHDGSQPGYLDIESEPAPAGPRLHRHGKQPRRLYRACRGIVAGEHCDQHVIVADDL